MSDEAAPNTILQTTALPVLRATERLLARLGSMADHLQLRARAWRLALDPQTRTWLAETKRSVADGSAKQAAASEEDVQRMIEERRRRLP